MGQGINLLTDQEIQQRRKIFFVHFSTVISAIVLLITLGISGYYMFTTSALKKEVAATKSEIELSRTKISEMSQIEITARNLGAKVTILKDMFSSRQYYSMMLEDLATRVPSTVSIEEFAFGLDGSVSISGVGDTYLDISKFIDNLLVSEIFTSANINTVNLDINSGKVSYFIVVNYSAEKLTKQYATK